MFETARENAANFDVYCAAWLTGATADLLLPHFPDQVRIAIERYSSQASALGFAELTRRYRHILSLSVKKA